MAVMRKEQKEIDRLGPVGIVREAFNLAWTHFRFFSMVQITLVLPLSVVLELAMAYGIHRSSGEQAGAAKVATADAHQLPSNFGASFPAGVPPLQLGLAMVVVLIVWAVAVVFSLALLSLSGAAIIYAVGLHYTGKVVSFRDVIRAVVPRLWMRLTITKTYHVFLLFVTLTVQLVGSFLLIKFHAALPVMLLGIGMLAMLSIICSICLEILFLLACGISVLEKDYGWAAVRSASKLLKRRVIVALLFQLLLLVPSVISIGLHRAFHSQVVSGDYSASSTTVYVIITVFYICWRSFVWQMNAAFVGVQYASFKAYHNEDLSESFFEKQATKIGYERIGTATVETKLDGYNAESLV